MQDLEEKINKVLPLSQSNLFHKNKLILSEKTLSDLEKSIKKNVKNPSKNIEVFVIRGKIDFESKHPLIISVSKYYITPELELESVTGYLKNFVYTKEDLDKYGFNKSHITKIIKAVKNVLVSFKKISSPISEVFEKVK